MKISTKSRYGMRLMLELAGADGVVSLKEIALRQEISEKYLEQIVISLSRAGLLISSRGARGGYRLARPAAEITVAMVLRATEGKLSFLDCDEAPEACCRSAECKTRLLWRRLGTAFRDACEEITLAEVMNGEV